MQPQLCMGQQVVQRIAKPGRAGHQAIARVGAVQAGGKVRHHHSCASKRRGQCLLEPILALQRLLAQAFGQPGLAVACGGGFAKVEVGGAKGFVARLELARVLAVGVVKVGGKFRRCRVWQGLARQRSQCIKVGPQRCAHKAHRAHLHHLALQPGDAQLGAAVLQPGVGLIKVQAIVFVVARHKEHRCGPAVQR